jgi:uncharacterized membrane protein (DUF4010 family)
MAAWQAAAIALAIGLLIGSERERSGNGHGVRSFALAGLAGALAALIHPLALGALLAAAAVVVATSHLRDPADSGITTEIALVLTVVLGGLTVTNPALAAAAGVATTVLLLAKDRLHVFVRDKITELELRDALKFFVAAFIVLPLVPHANVGPYGVIDPRKIWTFVVAVTALGWLGYVAVRLLGPRRGLPVAGLAGGFVSGAATTGAMARTARDPKLFRAAMAAALLASVATLVQLVLVTAVADRRVAGLLVPAAALGSAALVAEAGWLILHNGRKRGEETHPAEPSADEAVGTITAIHFGDPPQATVPAGSPPASWEIPVESERPGPPAAGTATAAAAGTAAAAAATAAAAAAEEDETPPLAGRRPFALIPALILAGILTVFLVLAAWLEHLLGPGGAVLAVAAAGLADAHAAALTAAGLAAQGSLEPSTAVLAAMAAVGVNTVVKLVLAQVAGGRRASTTLAALFAAPVVAVVLGLLLTLGLTS